MAEELLTAADVAAELKIPRATAYEYMRQMTRVVTGRHVRVTRRAFETWIREHTQAPERWPMRPTVPLLPASPPARLNAAHVEHMHITQPRRKKRPEGQ